MDYPLFDHYADAGGEKAPKLRSTSTEFSDGYKQIVFAGRHRSFEVLNLTFTKESEVIDDYYTTLLGYAMENKPFYFQFNGVEAAKLYTVSHENISKRHIGGLKWSLTVTFEEWSGIV